MPFSEVSSRTQIEGPDTSKRGERSGGAAEHERMAAVILDGMDQFVALLNISGEILEVNRAALQGAGHEIEEIRGRPFWTARWWQVSEEAQEGLKAAVLRAAGGEFVQYEVEVYGERAGLDRMAIDFSLRPIRGEGDEVEYLLAEGWNLTERKLVEARHELEHRMRAEAPGALLAAIVQSSDDAIISKDLDAVITSWNRGAEEMFGYTAAEAVGQPVTMLMPPERIDEEPKLLQQIRAGQRIEHYETVRRRKDGVLLDISLSISPVLDSRGQIIGASKIARNISDRKRIEATLLKAHGLAAAGRMAASVAHEINNPLEAVTNLLFLMRSEVSSEAGTRHLATAEEELARVARIAKKTLAYYRDTSKPEPVDLCKLITETLGVFEKKIDAKRIAVVRSDEPCTVRGFKGELQQLFSNLVANAVDAVEMEGEIEISCRESGDAVVASVGDDGVGIPREMLSRLFEPFFTTKEQHMGTGLGLWVSKEIAGKHGAEITVESSTDGADRGTTFTVTFAKG
jgi:PAS domain S-box-containing protein